MARTLEFTSEQITDTIVRCIGTDDYVIIPSLLKVLALQDARQAMRVLDAIKAGLVVAEAIQGASDGR